MSASTFGPPLVLQPIAVSMPLSVAPTVEKLVIESPEPSEAASAHSSFGGPGKPPHSMLMVP